MCFIKSFSFLSQVVQYFYRGEEFASKLARNKRSICDCYNSGFSNLFESDFRQVGFSNIFGLYTCAKTFS